MPVETQQVLIEFITDDTELQSTEERLKNMGKTDEASARIFANTNKQLAEREKISQKISVTQTKEQAVVNKLVASLKNLSGESKRSVENLLKLSTDEISAGFEEAGMSVDEYIEKLKQVDKQGAGFKGTTDQLKIQEALRGKLTLSVTKEQQAVNKLVSSMKGLTEEGKKSVQALLRLPTDEIVAGLDAAGVSADQFVESLRQTDVASDALINRSRSLKGQFRALTEELTRMKLGGLENTAAYKTMAAQLGELGDTIGDVKEEVRRLGSDTGTLDGLIGAAQGLAGGFAVAQGAAALFGSESEEVQEVLLRVNAAMSILQGLQQIQQLMQKQSALSTLVLNTQRKVAIAQIALENALTSKSVIVRGLATVAQRALNAAMSANPIGLIITALATVIGLFAAYASYSRRAAAAQAELNGAIAESTENLNGEIDGLKRGGARREAELVEQGARQSDILRQQATTTVQIEEARLREIKRLGTVIKTNENIKTDEGIEALKKAKDRQVQLLNESADAQLEVEVKNKEGRKQVLLESLEDAVAIRQAEVERIAAVGGQNTAKEFDSRRGLLKAEAALEAENAKGNSAKLLLIRQKLNRDLHTVDVAQREQTQKETLSLLETQLVKAQIKSREINERESQEEIDIRKKIITTTALFESRQEGLSQKQRNEIRIKALQETTELQRTFSKQTIRETIEDQISINNVELSRTRISEEDKLNLRIDNIILAASIEEEANEGLSAKIKEINAKRDADIKAVRLQSIQETLEYELREIAVNFAAQDRAINRELAGQDALRGLATQRQKKQMAEMLGIRILNVEQESKLINEQTRQELNSLDIRKRALKESFSKELINPRDYAIQLKEIEDAEAQAVEDAEARKRQSRLKSFEEQKKLDEQRVQIALAVAGELSNILGAISDAQSEKENAYISRQRRQLKELKEAGAITEREEILRIKKIDGEERKFRHQQAVREKQQALFNAILSTAAAVAKANPIVPLMILAGVAGAAQIAIIASKPIPKFARGKSKLNRYEGPGLVGESGAELVEKNGQMFVTKQPTMLWLGRKDIVYTHKETKEIINRAVTPTVSNKITLHNNNQTKQESIDYEKLGKIIGENTSTTLNIDGYKQFIKEKESFTTYLNYRRGY